MNNNVAVLGTFFGDCGKARIVYEFAKTKAAIPFASLRKATL